MDYIVKFKIDVISTRNLISRKTGELDITTDATLKQVNGERQALKGLVYADVQPKIKQRIFNVEITSVSEKNKTQDKWKNQRLK